MPHFLFTASYTKEGFAGVRKEGAQSRIDAVNTLAQSAGGRVVAAYWAFGEDDFYCIAELPDNAAAIGLATTVAASGAVTIHTTVLLTAKELDEGLGRQVSYRPPGT